MLDVMRHWFMNYRLSLGGKLLMLMMMICCRSANWSLIQVTFYYLERLVDNLRLHCWSIILRFLILFNWIAYMTSARSRRLLELTSILAEGCCCLFCFMTILANSSRPMLVRRRLLGFFSTKISLVCVSVLMSWPFLLKLDVSLSINHSLVNCFLSWPSLRSYWLRRVC